MKTENKSVLISIRPQWCELILRGKKTLEVRKSRPKLKPPFKVYIYCTKAPKGWVHIGKNLQLDTKVIAEFICDDIIEVVKVGYTMREALQYRAVKSGSLLSDDIFDYSCLSKKEIEKYLDGRKGYAWHISKLVIYDKPKELSEFCCTDNKAIKNCKHRLRMGQPEYITKHGGWIKGSYGCLKNGETEWCENCISKPLKRPPQSWCYVEGGVEE